MLVNILSIISRPQIWCLQLEEQQKSRICSTITITFSSSDSGSMPSAGVIKTLLITVGLGGGAGRKTSVRPAPLDPRDAPEDYRGQLAWPSHCGPHRSLTLPPQRAHDTFVQPLFNNYLLCVGRRGWGLRTYITDKTPTAHALARVINLSHLLNWIFHWFLFSWKKMAHLLDYWTENCTFRF